MKNSVKLTDAEAAKYAIAGGKEAKLGQLTAAGFDGPPGFVVKTRAYWRLRAAAGLPDEIDEVLISRLKLQEGG